MWDKIWDGKIGKPKKLGISTFFYIAALTAFTKSETLQFQRLRGFHCNFKASRHQQLLETFSFVQKLLGFFRKNSAQKLCTNSCISEV